MFSVLGKFCPFKSARWGVHWLRTCYISDGMTTAEKDLPYFLLRFFHTNKSANELQPFGVNLIISSFFFSIYPLRGILE